MKFDEILKIESPEFKWIDLSAPGKTTLDQLAKDYGLHRTSVRDCLEPYHLPKIEQFGDHIFIILRVYDNESPIESDSMNDLTRKIAIFASDRYLITIHRTETDFIRNFKKKWREKANIPTTDFRSHLLLDLMNEAYESFSAPTDQQYEMLERIEEDLFKANWKQPVKLKDVYMLKRRASSIRRVLRVSLDAFHAFRYLDVSPDSPYFKDVYENLKTNMEYAEEVGENIHQFLNLSFSIQAQQTNEVMRLLTLFSVFFLPLTLIAGIYGMNFKHMPELEWIYGYPFALGLMAAVALGIAIWFRKRNWF